MDKIGKPILLAALLTIGVILVGYLRGTPLSYFEFVLIDIISYFSYRIIYELRNLGESADKVESK